MTDLATLAIQIDSRQATDAARALDGLAQSGGRAEQATKSVGVSAGQYAQGVRQMGQQVGDLTMQLTAAAQAKDPVRFAFMAIGQQAGQMAQALQMMKGEASAFATFMAGPWGAAVIAATTLLGPLIANLLGVGDAAGKAETALDKMLEKYRQGNAERNKFIEADKGLKELTDRRDALEARIRLVGRVGPNGQIMNVYKEQQELKQVNAAILESTDAIYQNRLANLSLEKTLDGLNEKQRQGATRTRAHAREMTEAERAAKAYETALRNVGAAHDRMNEWAIYGSASLASRMADLAKSSDPASRLGFSNDSTRTAAEQLSDATKQIVDSMPDLSKGTADWNKQLGVSLDRLTRIGTALGGFGLLGGKGAAIGTLLSTQTGTNDKGQIVTLGDRIERIFDGKDGKFGKTMSSIIQGGATGLAVGSLFFGGSSKESQFGSFAGGALGQAFAESSKTLTKALGNFAGPLGAIAGSLLGGVLGGLLGKRPSGSGTVSNTGTNVTANDAGIKGSLSSFGLGLNQSVTRIADQLGGSVGAYNVGIGAYKGGFIQVSSNANDPFLGQAQYSAKSGAAVYDGLDATAALRAAIGVAITQGAIQGIRAGAQTLLKAGTDIEAQLGKALKFQGVFTDLKQATDPIGFALDNITKKFDDLRKIFTEAGASAEDYAQLEQLLALQRADAINSARRDLVGKVQDPLNLQIRLLELMGEKEKALAASRLLELAGLKDSLQPMQAMVYTLEDATSVIEKFTPLRDDLVKFRDSLLGGSSSSLGFLTGQFRSTALAAANGDATAMAGLRGAAQDYLDAAKENASSLSDYNRARAEVLAATNSAIFAANEQIDYQKAVIDAAKTSQLAADTLANLETLQTQLVLANAEILRLWKRWDNGENGAPLQVEVVTP